jgi:glycosyltransferase involved in cell wall biosynthesis
MPEVVRRFGLQRFLPWAQRSARFLPRPARRWLRVRLLAALPGGLGTLPDWTTPLLPGGSAQPPVPGTARAAVGWMSAVGRSAGSVRCLLVTGALDVGGMDAVVAMLARNLPAHGVDTKVLHTPPTRLPPGAPPGRLAQALQAEGVPVVESDAPDLRWLQEHAPDVISAHGAAPWVLEAASQLGIPYVDTLHGMHDLLHVDWSQEAVRSRDLARVVAVSELVRQQYLTSNPTFPAEHAVTVPNGFDAERQQPVDRRAARDWLGLDDEFLIVSLARFCLQKNSYGLVRAFARVAEENPSAHLLVAGRPDDPLYAGQVMRLRDSLPCADRVHLREHCAASSAVLAAADCFVLDSFFEGWPLATMEALCVGLPVVMSEVAGAVDQVGVDRSRGRVVPNPLGPPDRVTWEAMSKARFAHQANESVLVTALSDVCRDREQWAFRRAELAQESRELFSLEQSMRSHASLLVTVAGCPAAGAVEGGAA